MTEFVDAFSEDIWEQTYKDHNDITVDDTFRRVAKAIATVENTPEKQQEWEEKFTDLLSDFKGTSGGRIYANAGTDFKGTTLINCFVASRNINDLDSLDQIVDDVKRQALTLKSEGGWGQNFSWIRPRGSFIHGIGVESPGAVKYMEVYDKVSEIITSGSGKKSNNKKAKGKIRKGAMMGVLDVWHPDIIEFITAKQQQGRLTKFNMSVNCSDEFMKRVIDIENSTDELEIAELDKWDLIFPDTTHEKYKEEWDGNIQSWVYKNYPVKTYNTVSIKSLWNLIMESTYNRAEPGILFLDRANEYNPFYYGEHIAATNPSMPAGTLVHTYNGVFPIEELEGKKFLVKSLDGTWANANCFLSGEHEKLLELSLGGKYRTVKSTPKHKWPVLDITTNTINRVATSDLKVGDYIPLNRNEDIGICGDMSLTRDEGFFVGYFVGNGVISKRKNVDQYNCGITFPNKIIGEKVVRILNTLKVNKTNLCEQYRVGRNVEYVAQFSDRGFIEKLFTRYGINPNSKTIPDSVWVSNDEYIKGFVDGLLSADGHVSKDIKDIRISLTTSRKELAIDFSKLLSFAGINSNIYYNTIESPKFPNGKTYDRSYSIYSVRIGGFNVVKFNNVFTISNEDKQEKLRNLVAYKKTKPVNKFDDYIKITGISETKSERVWDISVYHNQHVFPAQWCYTGNCGEQVLAPGGVCCLGSMNLTQFINNEGTDFDYDKLKKYISYMVRFLDNVNQYSNAPLPEYVDSMRNKRRIGVGILGWGSSLFMLKVRFGSKKSAELREKVMSTLATTAYESSIDLAIEKGMFTYCDPIKHSNGKFVNSIGLSEEYMDKLRTTGIRNSSLLSIQPTGSTGIFANMVSGGLEPIFMPEYIRTVIVPVAPEEIADKTPKWYEGEWYETELFKFVKEGDEDMLRGVYNGITYKIDKNRGLLKEVACVDYGVRYLMNKGEWNSNADYAVTALNGLTAEDHLNDLIGFTKYIDSAVSKTINLPNEYKYEDFKDIYLTAYESGHVKGATSYRSGTMATVLSSKETENNGYDEEIILDNVKMPTSTDATMKVLKAEGRKWYLTIVWNETKKRPFALFVHTNHHEKTVTTHDGVEKLLELAVEKNIPLNFIEGAKEKIDNDNNATKITRIISLLLRHGVAIKNIVNVLNKVDNVFVGSFLFQITKYLATFIKDGEKIVGEKCMECGSETIIYQEGCKKCTSCGSSKCG